MVLLLAFVGVESKVAAPLIPLTTLRTPSLAAANLVSGLLWAAFLGLIYQATLFVQQLLGYPPLAAGASTIPIAVLSLVFSAKVAPRVVARLGAARTLGLGMAIMAADLALLIRVPSDATYLTDIMPAYLVVGVGLGLAEVSVQIAAFTGVADAEAGLAGGALETAREMGGALGLAVLVSMAVNGTDDVTVAFHRTVLGAAVLATAGAVVAVVVLHAAERRHRANAAVATAT